LRETRLTNGNRCLLRYIHRGARLSTGRLGGREPFVIVRVIADTVAIRWRTVSRGGQKRIGQHAVDSGIRRHQLSECIACERRYTPARSVTNQASGGGSCGNLPLVTPSDMRLETSAVPRLPLYFDTACFTLCFVELVALIAQRRSSTGHRTRYVVDIDIQLMPTMQ
jgi:hypothetical protein